MKKILFTLFLIPFVSYVSAQTITNVRAMQQDTMLVVVYDLNASAKTRLQVSFDGGETFRDAKYVSGEIGQQQAGRNRIAYWNAVQDAGYFDCPNMVFKVVASNIKESSPVAQPVQAATGTLVYDHRHVYDGSRDITYGYKNFLRNNCPEAYRAFRQKKSSMVWGGILCSFIIAPGFAVLGTYGVADGGVYWAAAGYGMMSLSFITGITLMSASGSVARRHSVGVYNNSCAGRTSAYNDTKAPMKLVLGTSADGIGLAFQF